MKQAIMLTCRDCRYGVTGLETGSISCLKLKEITVPEMANKCPFYDSISKKEWSWRDIIKR